jgi:hypothetical protein
MEVLLDRFWCIAAQRRKAKSHGIAERRSATIYAERKIVDLPSLLRLN